MLTFGAETSTSVAKTSTLGQKLLYLEQELLYLEQKLLYLGQKLLYLGQKLLSLGQKLLYLGQKLRRRGKPRHRGKAWTVFWAQGPNLRGTPVYSGKWEASLCLWPDRRQTKTLGGTGK